MRTMVEDVSLQSGRITALKAQVRSPGRVSVFIDGSFAFGINQDIVLECGLKKGLELSVEAQEAILERESHYRARSSALAFLAYRDRSENEIRRRLERSGFDPKTIGRTISYLMEARLLDDEAFAVSYAEGRFRSGGYGPVRIRHDLHRKGIGRAAADSAIEQVFHDQQEQLSTAHELAQRRWETLSREKDDRRRRKKVFDYLIRRGFTYETVRTVTDQLV